MNSSKDDHERTIAFAEIAFGQIKALRQLASPPHFEIWYAYPTGHSPSLNQMINEMLARDYRSQHRPHPQNLHLANRFTDRIDHLGAQSETRSSRSWPRSTPHLGRIISIGVATLGSGDSPRSPIERADVCLYAAKRSGRNRVFGETDPDEASHAASKVTQAHIDQGFRFRSFTDAPRRAAASAARAHTASSSGSS